MSAQPSRSDADALAAMMLSERVSPPAGPAVELLEEDGQDALPLSVLFARGQAAHRSLAGSPAQETLAAGVAALRGAAEGVRRLALFSSNEAADDVATGDLKYLLVPFYLAELLAQSRAEERGPLVAEAQRELDFFLEQCDAYGLLPAELRAARERTEPADPTTLRAEKVARFKRDKELAALLAALEARSARRGASRNDERETDAPSDDEAATREAWLLRIAAAVVRALDLGPSLVMETQMLAMRASRGDGGRSQQPQQQLQLQQQSSLSQGVAQAAAALARSDRERLRDGVFRPSHILPTMSIEQFGELEVARMQSEAAEGARRQARKEAELRNGPRPDFDAEEDAETLKARAWDDWKDEHPYGSGNSKRRPCG